MYNLFSFAYTFLELCPGKDYHSLVTPLVYGDDSVVRVDYTISHLFRPENIAKVMLKDLGLTYTDTSKVGSGTSFLRSRDVTFLKRSFRKMVDGQWGMVIAKESLNKALCWTSKGTPFGQTLLNVLNELSTHDEATWVEYVHKMKVHGAVLDDGRMYTVDLDCQKRYLMDAMDLDPYRN